MDLTVFAIPAFTLLLVVEWVSYRFAPDDDERGYAVKDTATSLTMGLGSIAAGLGWGLSTVLAWDGLHELTPLRLPHTWWTWVLVIVGVDFFYYWEHRAGHEVRLLWASHVVHHSSRHYNLSTALRQTWTGAHHIVFIGPMLLLGFPFAMVVTSFSINLLYQFWIHTERIGRLWKPIEYVFNTPSHHRVHHGSNPRYLDRNYGGILIVWDRLFRSFEPEGEPVNYGLTKNIETYNPLRVAFHEYAAIARDVRAARTWRVRFGRVLRGPGWQPAPAAPTAPAGAAAEAAA
ncbi:sterol desaturase family protein [Embleya sp. NPDC059237]|uniref:sterol desaturase family protein n=1 Tax=Embleya sp. NPDC059237 TaxID=3346784 RepID=UPI003686C0CB